MAHYSTFQDRHWATKKKEKRKKWKDAIILLLLKILGWDWTVWNINSSAHPTASGNKSGE